MTKKIAAKRASAKPRPESAEPPSALVARSRERDFKELGVSPIFATLPKEASGRFTTRLEARIEFRDLAVHVAKARGPIHFRFSFEPTPWASETIEVMLSRVASRLSGKPVSLKLHRSGARYPKLVVQLEDDGAPWPDGEEDPDIRLALELRRWARHAAESLADPAPALTDYRAEQRAAYREAAQRAWAAIHRTENPAHLRLFVESAIADRGPLVALDDPPPDDVQRRAAEANRFASVVSLVARDIRRISPHRAKDLNETHLRDALRAFARRGRKGGPPKGEESWSKALSRVFDDLGLGDVDTASHARNVRRAVKRGA